MPCLDENDVVGLVEGGLDSQRLRFVQEHIDSCVACRGWVAQVAAQSRSHEGPLGHLTEPELSLGIPVAGQVLGNRFRLKRMMGQGGMGIVYEAHDTLLNTSVA